MGRKPQHIWRAFKQPVNTGEETHTDTHTLRQEVHPSDHPSVSFLTLSSPVPAEPNKQLLLPFSFFPVKTLTFLKSNAPFFSVPVHEYFQQRSLSLCLSRWVSQITVKLHHSGGKQFGTSVLAKNRSQPKPKNRMFFTVVHLRLLFFYFF